MEVARIQAQQLAVLDGIAQIKLVRTDDEAFGANAEELALHGVEVKARIEVLGKDRIEGTLEDLPWRLAVGGGVLEAVGDPDIGDTGRTKGPAEPFADLAASDAVLDPELPDPHIAAAQGEAVVGLGVREEAAVEIEAETACLGPIDPGRKVFRAK